MISVFVVKFFVWILAVYGMTQIIVDSYLFERWRLKISRASRWGGELVNCMLCTSVWISLLFSVLLWSPTLEMFVYNLVDARRLAHMQGEISQGVDNISALMIYIMYKAYILWAYVRFIFVDMMLGSCVVWFLYVLENRLTSSNKNDTIYKQE
jgi:hypothetical protein